MTAEQMKKRTKAYAIRIVNLVDALANTRACSRLGQQLLDSGTSVGANYRAVCRAKSQADFIKVRRFWPSSSPPLKPREPLAARKS